MNQHLPNILTFARIAAAPIVAVLLLMDARIPAFALFIVASLTDFFDGWLARRLNVRSRLGTMLDPIADKLLVAAALIMLVADRTIDGFHVLAAVLILMREILISGMREHLAAHAIHIPVSFLAKTKTTVQLSAIVMYLAGGAFGLTATLGGIADALLWLAAAISLMSALDYARSTARHLG